MKKESSETSRNSLSLNELSSVFLVEDSKFVEDLDDVEEEEEEEEETEVSLVSDAVEEEGDEDDEPITAS